MTNANSKNLNFSRNFKNALKPKRILFIEVNLDGTVGGSPRCLLQLIKYLDRRKFQPFVLFYQENHLMSEFKKFCPVFVMDRSKGFVIKRDLPHLYQFAIKFKPLFYFLMFFQKLFNFVVYYIPGLFQISSLLKKLKIDIVNINNGPMMTDWLIVCKLLKIKCVSHFRGTPEVNFIKRKIMPFYDRIIAISQAVIENAKKQKICTKNFVLIHNGIDLKEFIKKNKKDPICIRKEFQQDVQKPLIGLINHIRPWKGQHVAVEAMNIIKNKYPDLKCILVGTVSNLEGDRNYFYYLKELISKYNLSNNIIFTGYREDVADIISAMDILLHTSLGMEGLPRIILEIMSLSKCIIASSIGPNSEIIEDGKTGFLVPPNDPEALAEKIDYLLSHPEVAQKMGKEARKRVERLFDISLNIKKTEHLYNQLLFQRGLLNEKFK